jgi:hypothetical protein
MKTNSDICDRQLRGLFDRVALDAPSPGFTDALMEKIKAEDKKAAVKRTCLYIAQIAAGVAAIVLIPGIVVRFVLPGYTLSLPRMEWDASFGNTAIVGLSVLLLLLLDMLLKRHFRPDDKN